ncbi:hypothetical protein [Candidatus Frankia alpina]|uniref:hypothetical protein n=1 Tax=Candidatus Frankia alpina TaxID=2699483 RepID=UPI0013D8D556|nr:hypothetical protein [Candidatus Frankia alpina]
MREQVPQEPQAFPGDDRVDPEKAMWWRPTGAPPGAPVIEFAVIPGGLAFRHSDEREAVVQAGWVAVRILLADLLMISPDLINTWPAHPMARGERPAH